MSEKRLLSLNAQTYALPEKLDAGVLRSTTPNPILSNFRYSFEAGWKLPGS